MSKVIWLEVPESRIQESVLLLKHLQNNLPKSTEEVQAIKPAGFTLPFTNSLALSHASQLEIVAAIPQIAHIVLLLVGDLVQHMFPYDLHLMLTLHWMKNHVHQP